MERSGQAEEEEPLWKDPYKHALPEQSEGEGEEIIKSGKEIFFESYVPELIVFIPFFG